MILDVFKRLNWVDVFFIIFLFRICYIAMNKGFFAELFKFLGTVLAIYLALHYYTAISDFLNKRFSIQNMPIEFLDLLMFIILAIIGYLVFVVLRVTFSRLTKIETVSLLNRWSGFVLGVFRGILFSGLIAYILVLSGIVYFRDSVKSSYLGISAFEVAPRTYRTLWDSLFSKFFPQEKLNKNIEEIEGLLKQ